MQIDGTLYLPSAGYNHILAGTISGTGTLNIQGTAITLMKDQLSLSISTVSGLGTYQIQQNGVCTINGNVEMSLPNITGTGSVSIASGNILTIVGNTTLSVGLSNFGTLSVNSGVTLTLNNNYSSGVLAGSGTISISSPYTLTVNTNLTSSLSFAGAGTLSIASGITLTVGGNITYSIANVSGAGTLVIGSGYTLTFSGNNLLPTTLIVNGTLALSGNYTLVENIPNVAGSLVINSGYTLTVASNITLAYTSVSGAGTLFVRGIATLTQSTSITLSLSTVNILGLWDTAGYTITIPSGTTVNMNVNGAVVSSTTTKGTLNVDGTVYWTQVNLLPGGASSTFPYFPLNITGSGIMIAGYNFESNAYGGISFSSTAIAAGSTDGSGSASGSGYEYYNLSAIEGSAVGQYCLAAYDGTNYYQNALIYIGTANTTYSVSTSYYWSNYYDPPSGTKIYAANLSGSAGTITLTGILKI